MINDNQHVSGGVTTKKVVTEVTITENALQAQIFQYHWNYYPKERGLLFHPNNHAKNAIEGNRLKAMGVVAGVADFIYLRRSGMLAIEIKLPGQIQSEKQKEWENLIRSFGYDYIIVTSLEQAKQIFEK